MLECRKEREGENMRKLLLSELMSKSGGRRCPITSECDLRPLAFRGHELTLRVKSRSLLSVGFHRSFSHEMGCLCGICFRENISAEKQNKQNKL